MSRFLVMYLAPVSVIDDWMTTDMAIRKPAEEQMRARWDAWMAEHAQALTITEAAGRTRRVSADGVSDVRNDLMLYSIVEAASHDDVAKMFADHPHLGIPHSSIEITEIRTMSDPKE